MGILGYDWIALSGNNDKMNLQSKQGNIPSKDKLPSCSAWFRQKAERKIMIERKRLSKLKAITNDTATTDTAARQVVEGIAELPQS